MPIRDQLIADWQRRLDVASEPPGGQGQRSLWLNRVRRRLYRFLLALYGDGRWNAPARDERQAAPQAAVFDAPDVLPLAGKPAKTGGDISAVLKAVAQAQASTPRAGPLIGGLPADSWVVVGAASGQLCVNRLVRLLRRKGISARLMHCGDDRLVEVRAKDRERAFSLIASLRQEVQGRERNGPFSGIHFVTGFTLVTILSPFFVILALIEMPITQHGEAAGEMFDFVPFAGLFLAGWGACITLYLAVAAAWNFSSWLWRTRDFN